jgi:hypothetical protein
MHKYRPINSLYRAPEPKKWLKRSGKDAGKQRVPPSTTTYSRFREKKLEIGREVCRERKRNESTTNTSLVCSKRFGNPNSIFLPPFIKSLINPLILYFFKLKNPLNVVKTIFITLKK